VMAVESSGHSKGNPRLYEVVENAPKTGKSPTVWAFPQLIEYLKVAAQPVQGPWPPHQEPRPDPAAESMPVAVADPRTTQTQSAQTQSTQTQSTQTQSTQTQSAQTQSTQTPPREN
jgi:hypothetical protein